MRTIGIAIFLIMMLTSCDGEFIPDPIDPRLPRYSEEGKDAAGCFINGKVWRAVRVAGDFTFIPPSNDDEQKLRLFLSDSAISISIDGLFVDNFNIGTNIEFEIDNRQTQFQSTSELHQQTIMLDGKQSYGKAGISDTNRFFDCRGEGKLMIRYAQPDPDSEGYYTVAGTFYFTIAADSCEGIEVRNGRFDYRIRAIED
ncbi:hypothetical protein [Tunicatimonas pelagia]|uniref:hypothetical protein n=1 Tax=Tunicatimonas pelagia TaxID=931531 RepID=UPI00266628F8|nr:hypothetical protein [Tunicatimonas pelagia]WKN40497.1 hypothetical protein P0M28_15750 [Tunicatimonas pelagia]